MKVTDIRTYRAGTVQEALALVRDELGPDASVLRTRQVRGGGVFGWLAGQQVVEVDASSGIVVPSRLPRRAGPMAPNTKHAPATIRTALARHSSERLRKLKTTGGLDLLDHVNQLRAKAPDRAVAVRPCEMSESMFRLFADLLEADVCEEQAREWVDHLRQQQHGVDTADVAALKEHLAAIVASELPAAGPIRAHQGRRSLVALVGPTGVGKTTTIAKLAANFRLREKRRVGLITVDTYRIAAVEQLRTYADIIDLPMEIVSTPREMHQAVARMAELDLILMDTAGRSPKDEVQIQQLKSMLAEAAPDEVHLVLSSVASGKCLSTMAEQFAAVGTTALVLTKLDEAPSLGNLLPLVRGCGLPMSYLTHGQNVPDDIAAADPGRLARAILGLEAIRGRR